MIFSVGFNYLHGGRHKGSFDKHWSKPEACGQLCDCQMLERFGCVTGYFLLVNRCTTMEYSTWGEKHFSPNQGWHTDTHFPGEPIHCLQVLMFSFQVFFLKLCCFQPKRKIKSFDPFSPLLPLINSAAECWSGCALNCSNCTTARFISPFPFPVWLRRCRSWPLVSSFVALWHWLFPRSQRWKQTVLGQIYFVWNDINRAVLN